MDRPLAIQIVSFDWPWPPTYGGIVDVFYRIDSLLDAGVAVDLHVVSGHTRPGDPPPAWDTPLLRVFPYARRGWRSALGARPYIVASRDVPRLLPSLAAGPPVILYEGVHATSTLAHPRLGRHDQWVRVHNREADYYRQLADTDAPAGQRLYYREEARRLARYEPRVLAQADLLLPASAQDEPFCEALAPGRVLGHRSYTSQRAVASRTGRGGYVLYHAAMHVADNARAAVTLADRVRALPDVRLVVAGRQPPPALRDRLAAQANVELVADPDVAGMQDLIAGAHVIALHAEHRAGYKVKVVESLAQGRFVLANEDMVHGAPGLRAGVTVADGEAEWRAALRGLLGREFTPVDRDARVALLRGYLRDELVRTLMKRIARATFRTN